MKILITGSRGFIGKNLIAELRNQKFNNIYEYDMNSTFEELDIYTQDCDFVFHLAGINRPKNNNEFREGNLIFTEILIKSLKNNKNNCPIIFSSSIQAELENPYGLSKKAGEDLLFKYRKETNAKIFVYRFPNVFGKWSKPNYNSVISTFSYNIANNLPIIVNDPNLEMSLVYIDDVINELIRTLNYTESQVDHFCYVEPIYKVKLGKIVDLLNSFKTARKELTIPDMSDSFIKKLYSTYLTYISKDEFTYDLKMNNDSRGSFTEFFKTTERGQISINISKPGIIKGNHWHHSKNEKFLVVFGTGVIRLRRIDEDCVEEYFINGDKLQVVDIPPGYTHNIENLGNTNMITVMWANEKFNPNNPDTIHLEV